MKKIPSFSALFTSILMVLSVASATWAQDNKVDVSLTYDDDDGTYYVNMPYLHDKLIIGTLTLTANDLSTYADPSTGQISFKVYDDGGKSGTYSADPASVLQIIVPEGYVLTLNGQIMTESINLASGRPYAYLNVYDAPTQNEEALIAEYVNSENVWGAVGPYVSTSNAMTLYFTAWDVLKDGLDLTVGVHQTHAITVNTLVAGGVVSGMTSAYENQTATLTATPENGYAFVKAVVIDGDGNSVDVTRSGNTFSFAMPTSDVTVTPYFADPTVLSFDENGCLNNGTHFHVECENSTCTITQGLQDDPNEGETDFRCWSDLQQHIDGDEGLRYSTIVLGESLNLGGYDEENAKCRMSFVPLGKNQSFSGNGHSFNGNDHTIENFCYIGENSAGFFEKSNSSLTFERVTFKNAYVATTATTGYERAGVLGSEFGNATFSDITIDGATVTGSVVGGVAGNITGMQSLEGTISNVVVKNSTISASINGGALAGVAYIYMSESSLFTDNTITGTGNLGGVVGKLEGAYGGKPVSVSGTSITTSSNTGIVGGFAAVYSDSTAYVMGGERGIIQQFSFEGSLSGGSMVGGIFGRVALSSVRYMIKNCYSVGDISGTGADTDELGYIIGSMYGSPTESDSIYNNYHFGSDEVELGIGGSTYTAELWSAGSGSVFSNVRNASGSLTANTLGYHKIDWYDNGNEGSSVDFFAGTVGYYEAVIRTVNGVVAEADMESGLLAAMLNYNLESKDESAVWISKSNSLPTFAAPSDMPNHMVVVVARGLPNPTGLESVNESYLKDNGDSEGGTVAYGFTAYTDATGSLASTKFENVLDEIETIKGDLGDDAMLVDDNGNIVSASTPINSYQVWHFTTPSTYDVVYQYCDYQNVCKNFENVTETALGFMTPKIDSYAESADAPLQLVPNVVDYSEVYHTASGLKFTFELQDESGNTIQGIASGDATPQGTEIWSFEDIAQKIRAAGIENVKTIVLKYSTPSTWYGEFPLLEVENPKLLDFEVDVYAYDRNSSMVQVIESSASGDYAYGSVEYGAAIKISKIKEVIGYNFDNTYSIAYQYKATLNGCTPSEQPVTVPNAEKTLGTVDELVEKMSACGTAEWVVDNLNTESATDLVILDNAKMASFTAQRKYGNNVSERVVITPNYTLVQYNLSFNLNLPDDLGVDSSSVFLGRNWAAVKTMDVEHPTLPKVYTTSCPKMKGWSWVADTSVFQEWDTKYVTTFSDRYGNSFVNYATFDEENGNAASAFGYWPSSCTDSDVPGMPLVFAAMEDNSPVLNNSKFHGNIVLKQSVDGTNDISHKSKMVQNVDAAGYHYQTTLPVVDDTLSFIVEASAEKGYTIEGITFVGTEKENHGIDETDEEVTLGFDEPELTEATTHVTSTLAVNTAMLTAMQFNVTFNYMRYNVEFVRPTDESAVGVSEVYVPDTYSNDQWMDGHVYTAEDVSNYETNVMPQLYATGKCMVWSENPSYLATDSVYTAFNWIAVNEFGQETKLYPIALTSEMDSDHCSGGPTETFTVTANVNLPDGLARLELRQVIGVEGDGDHADTIKHEMVQDGTSSKFTLEIPKVALSQAETESYVPFTFEIHAVTKDGYTTYSNSYYRKITDAGEEISETIAGGTLTTNGNDEEFYVDLIDGDYTIAFDTTGWDHFVIPFSGDYTNYRYDIYIADEDIDQFETYTKPDGSTRLPKFYAATDEGANNTSQTWAIAGWTIYADSAFCLLGSRMENGTCVTSSSKNLFTTFSGDLIVAAKKASLDDGFFENKVIKLYPVWTSAGQVTYAGINKIKASCPEQTDGCDDNDRPMVLTASQTFTLNGESITLKHSSDVFIPVPWEPGNRSITLDIDFQANPGYEFNSVTLQNASEDEAVYTPADKKLRLITQTHETNVNFVPVSLSYTPYTIAFDISSLDSEIVAFGQSWYDKVDAENGTAVMNVGTANEFPNLYAFYGSGTYGPYSFNEVYWAKEQAPEDETEWNAWYGTYISSSMKQPFNSDLVTQYFGENSTETAMAAYPMVVSELTNGYDARDAWPIWFRSDNDSDPKSYHGSVVISQTWNGKTYKQKSQFTSADAHTYLHRLFIPKADDTLVYNVSLEPDPGYAMTLKDYIEGHPEHTAFGWSDDDGGSADPPEGEDWGYNLDPEVMTLKVQPSRMSSWANEAYVSFTVLHYNVEFSRPTDAEVFVASKWVSDNKYEVDWFESQTDVTVNNIKTPILYDENGCQVYWKVKDSEAHIDTGIVGELVYMTSTETLETAINVLVPDTDESNRNCDNAETYKQTLTVEGEGTILLEQVIGDAPESPEDPAQVVLAHSFVEDEATGVLTLNVPAAYNEVGPDFLIEQTGVKFRVVAVPAENYTLDKISYETAKNGNVMTVTVEDSAEVNVMESLPWTVKFKSLAPIYVTYDLSLGVADSADTYLPTNATKSEKLELANNADTVVFWKPYRASTCFQGWSTTAAANYTADDSAYTTFNAGNFTEFSTNPDNPTTLYAIWGDDCSENRNLWTVENGQMNATLVLYQLFGDDTLFHEVLDRRGLTLEGDSFDVYIDPVRSAPKSGYHYAADAKYELSYRYTLPVTEGSSPDIETVEVEPDAEKGGVWHLTSVGIPSTPTYTFTTDVEMMSYLIVFDVNAGDAPVFYGTDWVKEKTLTLDSGDEDKAFPQDLRRTDACFEGWVIPGIEEPEIYSNFDEVVDALKDVVATVETVQNDEGESVDHTYYTLSAQWNSNCTPETFKIFSGMTEGQGTFQVSQNPDAENAVWMEVPEDGLVIPELEGLSLAVKFTGADTYETGDVITGVKADAENAEQLFEIENGESFTVAAEQPDVKLNVEANLIEMNFALDAGYDDVFYGPGFSWNWSSEGVAFGAALPSNLYRAGYKLAGWKFDNEETPMLNLNEDFATAYNAYAAAHEGNYPDTLHAVWTVSGVIPAYSLQLTEETLEQNAGVLTLSQTIGDSTIVHVFEDGMLDVPMIEDLTLTVNFAIDTAHSFDGETPITLKSIITDETVGSYATGDEVVVHTETLGAAGTVMVNVATKVDSYEFAFDINVGEDDQVFYGKDWFATKSYDMSEEELDSKFPTSAYQTQNCLGGFAFTAMEPLEDGYTITMPDVKFYTGIDSAFIADYKALEEKPTTLYAVWLKPGVHCSAITSNVMISALNASEEGEFTLTNAGMEIKLPASEESAAVQVPVAKDLEFTVTFNPTSAYDFDAETGTITISLVDGYDYTLVNAKTYSFAKNATLKATPTLKAVAFDLNANAGEASVFYGKEYAKTWTSEGAAYGAELPKNIYRTDANLLGWAFEAIEDDAAEVWFTKFDKDFMDAYAAQETAPTTLYAVWKTNAERATYTITSTEETLGAGNLVVAQWAFADSIGYAVGADGLKVPAENNLIFRAYFEPLNTHSVVGDLPVALDVDGEVTNVFVGQDFVLAGNTEITVATENDVYVLAFDANADGATLFYGDNWFSGKTYSPADAEEDLNFPTSLYRTDKCLDGFAFNADESVVYKSISDEFITEFKERELTSPVTLVAVWKNCPETYANYTVAAKDASEGVFTLTNKYGEIANKFEVGSEALVIPAAEDLTFSVTFAENVTVDYENKVSVLAGDETVAMVADGATVSFSQNSELKAVASVLDLTFAFDANKAANDTVFYNSEWSATKSYDLADEEFDYHFPTAYQTSKCLAGFAFSKTATESEAFQEVGTEFIKAYKALEVKPTTLYAVWTAEDCNHGYVVLRSGNTEAEGSFTISDAVNSYELSAGSLMAVPTHVVDFKVTFHEGYAYELENIDLLDDDLNSYSGFANGAEYSFDMNTVLKANVEPKSKGLVFALNADDATVFYGTSYDPKWFENLMNGDFYNDNLPSGIYRNDAVFVGWSFTQMSGVAEGSKYFTKIDDDFYEAFKNHAETRENFDTPDTLYAVWKSAPNREIYTVTVGNKASEGKFRLTNASGGLSNEFLVDATTMLVIPAENDLVFTVSFVSASETAEYEGISVISTTGTQIAVIEMGDEYTFRKDVMLRAISYMPTMEFALDVNAGNADVFYESDFGFKWWASSYGQNLPTGIYRADAKLVGWSLDKNATPDKAFKEIDDAFNEAVESYMEHYGEDLIGDISEGDFDLSKIQEMYGMDFAQMSRGPVLYAVWEKANVKTVSVKSNSLRQGTLTLQQLVDDSTFTFVVGEKGLKVPYVEGGLEFRAHFEANESHLLNSGKSLVWNAAAADTTKNDEFVLVSEATSFDALVKVVGFNLAFNAESKETLFYGDDWTSGKKVIAKGTSASQFPTMVYSASRCLVGWTLKNDAVAYTEMQDELANKLYEKYPKLTDTTKINMYALWSDSPDQCSALMTRVSVEQDKGEVMLVEKTGESNEVVHKFNEMGSMMLPSDIVSAEWTLRSAPDSSYALDSLTIVRNDKLLAVLREGGNLPGNMDNAVFKAHFSKANKTPVEIVERHFAQSGNAIQLNIKASEFEVTRGVEARVRVFDVKGDSVVLDSLLGDSVAMGFESEVVLRMKRTGDYKVVLTLEDEKESDAFEQEFGVKSSIASVGKDGWQMVSLAAVDTSAINWTSDDQVFYWWDEFGNGGDYWQYRRYNRGDSVVATRGAWYSSLDSLPLVLKRDIEDDGEDAVWKLDSIHSGWNLVANTHGWEVSLFAGHADEEKDVDEESEISFYRYNSETADYEETKYLKPYEAVWAKVGKKKNWKVSAAPVFAKATEREPQPEKPEGGRMLPKRVLAKASTKDRWVLQAMLSDKNGKQDAWNILGAGNNPFSAEEPPESMGDHVNLSIVEGKRALAKSIKSASDEMEWTVALSASNDRVGYLTLVGIDDVNAFGYRVFVTVDGNTTEMKDGVPLQVLLKSNAKTATVRVAPAAKVVAQNSLKGLRSARLGGKLKVSFETTGLAGTNARVDLLDMKGHVMSTVNAKTLEGTNALVLDAPKSGLYMLRVRAGSQQQAAKIVVR
ncbi:MAG: T9SS type A sorting domain-containing protein [Fibrobacter sp.]|uniref:InlB B-repeat-containing protein n=1 Tax=Fibrobacter sp. TaxID=35828 RepID=UPI002A9208E3|nr:T9SS type A sorting domain-containing protein [Fibrobacter sp.]MDY6264735.1 T9SS type A sorting domain-containing protein [Fibrobacter sp.]